MRNSIITYTFKTSIKKKNEDSNYLTFIPQIKTVLH